MNDTHGVEGKGWYGFDLDGTLAKYDGWKGIDHIGEPVAPMVRLVQAMHKGGLEVRILTARVAPRRSPETKPNPYREGNRCIEEPGVQKWALKDRWSAREFIQEWCYRHLGFVPKVTYRKDHLMLNLFDDRVTQVEPNTGRVIGRLPDELDGFSQRRGRYVEKKCERCGKVERMYSSARCCAECRAAKAKESNREASIRRALKGD